MRYLIVGVHAVALHARPRATKDLDLLLDPDPGNAERALEAIRDFFGDDDLGYSSSDLSEPGWIVQLGTAPIRIDLLNRLDGTSAFDDLWSKHVEARFGDQPSYYLLLAIT